MIYNVKNTKQIPTKEWPTAIWRLQASSFVMFYIYNEAIDQWIPLDKDSQALKTAQQMWEEQLERDATNA